ncbi:MAG: hypothetical protein ABI857_08900 [Acidobacteriota bacterium]
MKHILISALLLLAVLCLSIDAQNAASKTQPLSSGAIAPDFTLSDVSGKSVTLSAVKQTTVLVFYRGYW